jgi:hypothetical protein
MKIFHNLFSEIEELYKKIMSNENNSEIVTFEIGYSAAAEFKGEALFAEHGPPENGKSTLFVLNYFFPGNVPRTPVRHHLFD